MPIDIALLIISVTSSFFSLLLNIINGIKSNHFRSSCSDCCTMDVETEMKNETSIRTSSDNIIKSDSENG